ncbi:hypothetical protein RugamoR57_00370 [Duganella caerulea]
MITTRLLIASESSAVFDTGTSSEGAAVCACTPPDIKASAARTWADMVDKIKCCFGFFIWLSSLRGVKTGKSKKLL